MMPFHIWLPEAHVEAPTPGSVILASILLKLGTYAIVRFLVGAFSFSILDFIFFIFGFGFFGFIFPSLVAFNQIDAKKIIAYSSVSHMNFSILGFFSFTLLGLSGAFFMMYGHAFTSAALFFGIGILYERFKTRLLLYYGGLATLMPITATIFFIFILSNFGFPGTVNFVGEFLIIMGGFVLSSAIIFLCTLGLFLSLFYSLLLYNRLFFVLSLFL
jgi:NADH:ubiquinone oxidoreductase subunit 4 (subunit M)